MALTPNKYQKEAFKTFSSEGIEEFLGKIGKLSDLDWEERASAIDYMKLLYAAGKLNGEAGEVAEEIFKSLRVGGKDMIDRRSDTIAELGDVIWYVAAIATLLNVTFEDILEQNLGKVRAKHKKAQSEKHAKS
jgi:NTP pyrophosphatase (non-canonical NTP hydrolase)